MAKRMKKSTVVLVCALTAVVAGGIVAGIASASNGFDRDILDEWTSAKEDYVKIDLTNDYENEVLDVNFAKRELNYGHKDAIFDEVTTAAGCYMTRNALVVESGLSASFDNDGYNRIKITASADYEEIFENKDGKVQTDIFGNDIIQEVISEDVVFTLNGEEETLEGVDAEKTKKYPKTESLTYSFDDKQTGLDIVVSSGGLRITSIELWNVVEDAE